MFERSLHTFAGRAVESETLRLAPPPGARAGDRCTYCNMGGVGELANTNAWDSYRVGRGAFGVFAMLVVLGSLGAWVKGQVDS